MALVKHRFKGVWTIDTTWTEQEMRDFVETNIRQQVLAACRDIIKPPAYKQRVVKTEIIIAGKGSQWKQLYPKTWFQAETDLDENQQNIDLNACLTAAAAIVDAAFAAAGVTVLERELKFQPVN